jgi:hypothetical protein
MEDFEEKIIWIIDVWGHETFFKGDELDEDALHEGISWLYYINMERMPKVLVYDSPLMCQLMLHSLSETDIGKSIAYPLEFDAWQRVDERMNELAWTDIWCKSLPTFMTADNLTRLRTLGITITRHIKNAVNELKIRFYKFSEDNLFNRYSKVAFSSFLNTAAPEEQPARRTRYIRNYIDFLKAGCFLSLFFKGLAVISRRPKHIKFNSRGQLHNDGGAAIEWRDGWKQFYLNNVIVTEEIAVTPAEFLDPKLILKTNNADVKREIVRKIGIERVILKLGGKTIDSWNGYELLRLDISEMRIKPTFLKMKNPSIGTYHIEGVPPGIMTCKGALSWRVGGLKWNPKQLT